MTFVSKSPEETEALGEKLTKVLKPGQVVAFFGDMGMGKTVFVRGMSRGVGGSEYVSSPTFSLVNEYGGNPPLVHFDMYRISTWDDLYTTGFFDYIDLGAVLAVEWSENIENALPEDCIRVEFTRNFNAVEDDFIRNITITGDDIDDNFGN